MNKLWRVAMYEYRHNVFKKSFVISLLSIPLMMALSIGTGFILETLGNDDRPVGYVDQAGVLVRATQAPAVTGFEKSVEFIPFSTETEARTALEANKLQAYYLLPADYLETRSVKLVFLKKPGENATRQFYDFLQVNLMSSQSPEYADRAAAGTEVTVRSIDGRREVPESGPTFGHLMSLLITGAFLTLLFMSSGYLMSALADEKENRTIEILVTSASSQQVMGGKVIGILVIGLTLLASWIVVVVLGIFIASRTGIGWFQDLRMDWGITLASAAIALPAYVLASALMAALGAVVTTSQESQSISTIFALLHLAPLYVGWGFLTHPNSVLSILLSVLPFTSLMTVGMRNIFASVPAWQVAASVCVQTLCAIGALWLAGRAFRLGILRYGQRLSWRRLFTSGQ
jgi:ABC-2 type transport system permease protein